MFAAWEHNDIDGVVGALDPSYIAHSPFAGKIEGKEAARKFFETFLNAFTDQELKILSIVTKGDTVAFEYKLTATFKGPLRTFQGTIPPTGRRIEFAAGEFFRVNSKGLITEERPYYDSTSFLKQLNAKT